MNEQTKSRSKGKKIPHGRVSLYSIEGNFVTSKLYKKPSERKMIIETWKTVYALDNVKYYLVFEPDVKLVHSKYDFDNII